MSAGLNRGTLGDGEYTTFDSPSDYQFIETLLHDCFDVGGSPSANIYYEVLVEFNYGPHYMSEPSFKLQVNKVSRKPRRGRDANGSFQTNLLLSKGCGVPAIRSLAHKCIEEKEYLPEAARDAIIEAIDAFEPRHYKLPGDCRGEHAGPAGDESDWGDNPFVEFTDDGPRLRMWDTDSEGVAVHTSANSLGLDSEELTGIYVQGEGIPFTPVESVVIDGEEWQRPPVAGLATEYVRDGTVTVTEGTAHITTRE